MTSPPAMPEWQMTPRARRAFIALIAAALAVLFAGSAWMTYDTQVREDPGVRACGSLADGWSRELTEADYRRLHRMFERSDRAALREHGVKAVEAGLTVTRDAGGADRVVVVAPGGDQLEALKAACAAEGA